MVCQITNPNNTHLNGKAIILPDGRHLGYLTVGNGNPVLYFHGTASSRLEVNLLKNLTQTSQLQIIGIDRPGYGLSTFKSRKNLHDFTNDVNFLTDYLGLGRFAVLGWSGGGPFALAYAALFPERITQVVVAGAPALPFDVATAHNLPFVRFIMKLPFVGMLALKNMRSQVMKANVDVSAFLKSRSGRRMLSGLSETDLKFFSDPTWLALMYGSMAEAFRQGDLGVKAVFEEHQLFLKPWDVDLSKIPADKVFIWQGTDDKTCRVENAYRLVGAMPGGHLEIFGGQGHCVLFGNLGRLGEILGR
jgi:pimeloyl-ACP methyl ester carboxylesterase